MYWIVEKNTLQRNYNLLSYIQHPILGRYQEAKNIGNKTNLEQIPSCHLYSYTSNENVHRDLGIQQVDEVIHKFAELDEEKLLGNTSSRALDLLATNQDIRQLKRTEPHKLVK